MSSLLHSATLVSPDRCVAGPLAIAAGRVTAAPPVGAYELDLRGHLVFAGLINAHDHLHLNNVPSLPQHCPFANSYGWISAFRDYFDDPAVARAVAVSEALRHWQGGLKNLLCGATTVAHHDPWHPVFDDPAFPVRLLQPFGWAHSLGLGMGRMGLPRYGPPVVESFAATPQQQPWIIHLAEGTDEIAAGELAQLADLGCLASNSVLVHGAGLTPGDTDQIIAHGAAVVWCPASNLRLLGRTLDPRRLFDAGRLTLGSDSRLTGAFDLLDELRCAAAHSDLRPAELLRLVSSAAHDVLALPDAGALDPGCLADLLIVRDRGGDPYQALLDTRRGDIRAVVRGGVPAIADPDFAAWFEACGIAAVPVTLDGRPKLIAAALFGPPGAVSLELNLQVTR
jgi:cytosine/adenosine deaminase-related metal-dependent hydrolase